MSVKHPVAGFAAVSLVVGQIFHLPSPLQDAVTHADAPHLHLRIPLGHLLTTPFSVLADMITYNSARQDKVLVAYLLLSYWAWYCLWRGTKLPTRATKAVLSALVGYAAYLAVVLGFLAGAILCPRPAARLESSDPNDVIIDFHSHTSYSHDGRRAFTPEANMKWHRKMGFDAAFITDHNLMTGTQEANNISDRDWRAMGYRSLKGEEVSLHDTHIGILGNDKRIDNTPYNEDLPGVFRFLNETSNHHGIAVMNLPEYWLHHPQSRWADFIRAGATGFEIVNAVPIAMDFPEDLRRAVIELCRKNHLFFYGVTDNHGWGSASFVWNVMRIPGNRAMDPDALENAVLAKLRKDGPDAMQVITRVKQPPLPIPWILIDPLLSLWVLCRTFSWPQTLISLLWISVFILLRSRSDDFPKNRA